MSVVEEESVRFYNNFEFFIFNNQTPASMNQSKNLNVLSSNFKNISIAFYLNSWNTSHAVDFINYSRSQMGNFSIYCIYRIYHESYDLIFSEFCQPVEFFKSFDLKFTQIFDLNIHDYEFWKSKEMFFRKYFNNTGNVFTDQIMINYNLSEHFYKPLKLESSISLPWIPSMNFQR